MPFDANALRSLGLDPQAAATLGALSGLRGLDQAGFRRTAGPMGSIAQNLMPLLQAVQQAKVAESQAVLNQLLIRAQLMKAGGDPEKRAAEIEHLKALASSETALAEKRKGEGAYRDAQQKRLDELLQGQAGGAPGGMKPTVTYGASGPSISFKSDVMSPEAFQQQKELAGMRSGTTEQREKDVAVFKAQLARDMPKMSDKDLNIIANGKTLLSLMDSADEAISTIPKDISRRYYAKNAFNYQVRAENPKLANAITMGSFGMKTFDTDSRLDPVFSWIGQVKSALASFNLQSQKGGIQLLNYLNDHFPGYGDSPEAAQQKLLLLRKDKAVIQQRITDMIETFQKKGTMLNAPGVVEAPDAGGPGVAWMGRTRVLPDGTKRTVWLNPDTGEHKDLPEGQMPGPIPDLGLR